MAKEHRKECPDCDGSDYNAYFSSRGNGICSNCHGEGMVPNPLSDFFSLGLGEHEIPCEHCAPSSKRKGNGQCQTCGGEGYVYYNDNFNTNNDNIGDDLIDGNDSGSYIETEEIKWGNIFLFIACTMIIIVLIKEKYFSSDDIIPPPVVSNQYIPSVSNYEHTPAVTIVEKVIPPSYPDSNKVKIDLIGKHIEGWSFDNLSEFKQIRIINQENDNNKLIQTIELILAKDNAVAQYNAQLLVSYALDSRNTWQIQNVIQNSISEIYNKNEIVSEPPIMLEVLYTKDYNKYNTPITFNTNIDFYGRIRGSVTLEENVSVIIEKNALVQGPVFLNANSIIKNYGVIQGDIFKIHGQGTIENYGIIQGEERLY